jgi:SET domain-containing protein
MPRKCSRPFRVGRSRTGLGLFATEPIRKGQAIVEYRGRRITAQQAYEIERHGSNRYLFEINKQWTIDGSSRRNFGRYVNHACEPNAEAIMRRTGKLEFVASRWIEPGEEITIDYGEEYFALFFAKKGCKCMACSRTDPHKRSARKPPGREPRK